uniref:Uncharacterized protein n=1 Tax=Anguilla anguilla TaxID=7936 RepID=A0A0E9XE33_ANGAN
MRLDTPGVQAVLCLILMLEPFLSEYLIKKKETMLDWSSV